MRGRRGLYFALGVLAIVSLGQATGNPLALSDQGIEFPDGTVQTSAPMDLAAAANGGLNGHCEVFFYNNDPVETCSFGTVGPGQILVVEFMSSWIQLPNTQQRVEATLMRNSPFGNFETHRLQHSYDSNIGYGPRYIGNQTIRAYVRAGETLQVRVERFPFDGEGGAQFFFSGYQVDAEPF